MDTSMMPILTQERRLLVGLVHTLVGHKAPFSRSLRIVIRWGVVVMNAALEEFMKHCQGGGSNIPNWLKTQGL
jgi:hypothetical protein